MRLITERATAAGERSGLPPGRGFAAARAGLRRRGRLTAAWVAPVARRARRARRAGVAGPALEPPDARGAADDFGAAAGFIAAAASSAACRACLAAFFDCLRSLRASFNRAFRSRTCFLADSAVAAALADCASSRRRAGVRAGMTGFATRSRGDWKMLNLSTATHALSLHCHALPGHGSTRRRKWRMSAISSGQTAWPMRY